MSGSRRGGGVGMGWVIVGVVRWVFFCGANEISPKVTFEMILGPGDPKTIWCQTKPAKITIYPSN